MRAAELLREFASGEAAPAAGSAAALTGALAAALVQMVATLTVEKADGGSERLRVRYGPYRSRAQEIATAAGDLQVELEILVQADAEGVEALVRLRKQGEPVGPAVLRSAVDVPLRIARAAVLVAEYGEELLAQGYRSAAGDADVAARLAFSAAEGAVAIADANLAASPGAEAGAPNADQESRVLHDRLSALRKRRPQPDHSPSD